MPPRAAGARAPLPLLIGFAGFLVVLAFLVISPLMRPRVPTFAPEAGRAARADPSGGAIDTITVDARDEGVWQWVDLSRGAVLQPPDTAGWDLAFRRFHVIAAQGVVDAGGVSFERAAPAPGVAAVPTRFTSDTVNPAIDRWYRYNFLTHLLVPRGSRYLIQVRGGHWVKLEFLSYYCSGPSAGCVTFRYAFLPGARPPASSERPALGQSDEYEAPP